MDPELRQALADLERRLSDQIEHTETKLLTAFHEWAQTYEVQVRERSRNGPPKA